MSSGMASELRAVERRQFRVGGIVQGVGFRPFVYSLARRHGLGGFVLNDGEGVVIEVEGVPEQLDAFVLDLREKAPALARIDSLVARPLAARGEREFAIAASEATGRSALISPDVATCDDCLRELFDPADRRYRYPFINCTNCGPRFTITRNIPYDRPSTSMAVFPLCAACQAEYNDPLNRRFHAQPNACWNCGPKIQLW